MPKTITLLRAAWLLAPGLALTACQPVIASLELAAESRNAQLARVDVQRNDRPQASVDPTDRVPDAAAPSSGNTTESSSPSTSSPSRDTAPAIRDRPGVVYAAALASPTPPPTATPDPFLAAGEPVRLEIPAIQVDAAVESVGLTAQNAMDVPKAWMNAGWYSKGFRPGEPGNAVIAGHLDSNTGGPAVFWSLHDLAPGDDVFLTYANGLRLQFQVQGNQIYDYDADGQTIDTIFGPGQTADLNLITCKGTWDYGNATYSKRLVVFTTLVGEAPSDPAGQ